MPAPPIDTPDPVYPFRHFFRPVTNLPNAVMPVIPTPPPPMPLGLE